MKRYIAVHLYGEYVYTGSMEEGMSLLDKLVTVNKTGYGREAKYVPKVDGNDIEISFITDSQYKETEEGQISYLTEKVKGLEDSNSKHWSERSKQEQKIKELEVELKTLKGACPHGEGGNDAA